MLNKHTKCDIFLIPCFNIFLNFFDKHDLSFFHRPSLNISLPCCHIQLAWIAINSTTDLIWLSKQNEKRQHMQSFCYTGQTQIRRLNKHWWVIRCANMSLIRHSSFWVISMDGKAWKKEEEWKWDWENRNRCLVGYEILKIWKEYWLLSQKTPIS